MSKFECLVAKWWFSDVIAVLRLISSMCFAVEFDKSSAKEAKKNISLCRRNYNVCNYILSKIHFYIKCILYFSIIY